MLTMTVSTQDKLDCYLSTDPEAIDDALAWWNIHGCNFSPTAWL